MRTSLTDIQATEQYLTGNMGLDEAGVFEARLLTYPVLNTNSFFQQQAYRLLQLFGRRRLRGEIAEISEHLFTSPEYRDFQQEINKLFKK